MNVLKATNQSLSLQIAAVKTEKEAMLKKEEEYQHEKKEMEIENNGLKQELSALKQQLSELKAQSIDPSKYKSWDHENILFWIMSLDDGKFKSYEQKLRQNLAEEEVEGNQLNEVNETDIKGWGITKFGDKKCLLRHIQSLVQQNQNAMINEGHTAYV